MSVGMRYAGMRCAERVDVLVQDAINFRYATWLQVTRGRRGTLTALCTHTETHTHMAHTSRATLDSCTVHEHVRTAHGTTLSRLIEIITAQPPRSPLSHRAQCIASRKGLPAVQGAHSLKLG